MISLPEESLVLEIKLGNARGIFPVPPVGPHPPKIDAVPQFLGSQGVVHKYEVIAALDQNG